MTHLGLCGYATAGKDVVADVLVEEYGYVKVNMSDALNDYLCILNPILSANVFPELRYADLVNDVGYVKAKEHAEVRRLLQTMGTEVGRAIDPDMWVKELDKRVAKAGPRVVTTGIRFTNEIRPNMTVVEVDRPGVGPLNDHPSESLDPVLSWALVTLYNGGTVEDLRENVRAWVEEDGLAF